MKLSVALIEVLMGFYMLACIRVSFQSDASVVGIPFLVLYASGYFFVGLTRAYIRFRGFLDRRAPIPAAA